MNFMEYRLVRETCDGDVSIPATVSLCFHRNVTCVDLQEPGETVRMRSVSHNMTSCTHRPCRQSWTKPSGCNLSHYIMTSCTHRLCRDPISSSTHTMACLGRFKVNCLGPVFFSNTVGFMVAFLFPASGMCPLGLSPTETELPLGRAPLQQEERKRCLLPV